MSNNIKRPPAVWLTQGLLMIFALLWLASLVINLAVVGRDGTSASPVRVVVAVSAIAGFVLLLTIAFVGLAKKRLYGKRLGVLVLSCLWLLAVYAQVRPPSGPLKRFEYANTAELVVGSITTVVVDMLFLILILRLAFAKSVNKFFHHNNTNVEASTSPAE